MLEETENVHCLIIDDVHAEDAAQYTVEIANEYGVQTDSAALTITCKFKNDALPHLHPFPK